MSNSRKKERQGFMIFWENIEVIKRLPEKMQLKMLYSMADYAHYGVLPEFDESSACYIIWPMLQARLDADKAHYDEVCEQRRKAAEASHGKNNTDDANAANAANAANNNSTSTQPFSSQHNVNKNNKPAANANREWNIHYDV